MKKETLEEAAKEGYNNMPFGIGLIKRRSVFLLGAKWQAERMYSEEDMRKAFYEGWILRGSGASFRDALEKWFEQFKKK
jgi:hypothetical protein